MYTPCYRFAAFDLDGTLLDSMPVWRSAAEVYLARYGQVELARELGPMLRGMSCLSGVAFLRDVCLRAGIPPMTKEDLYAYMGRCYLTDVVPKAGVRDFLAQLRAAGVRMCVATASPHVLAEKALTHHGLMEFFEFVVTAEDYPTGKSHPDMFLGISRRFGCAPSDIALFEDALYSIRTGTALGMHCVAIEDAAAARERTEIQALAREYYRDYHDALNR